MLKTRLGGLLCALAFAAPLLGQSQQSLLKALQETSNWSPAGPPVSYTEKTLDALDGKRARAIEGYGFSGATVQDWKGPNGQVRLTLYEMVDSTAAYGLYTLDRDSHLPGFAALPIGAAGFRAGNRAEFWQSDYVVKLEGEAAALDELAPEVSKNIFGRSRKPPVSSHLPPEDLIPLSDKYIVTASEVGPEFKVDPRWLGFEDSVEIATASYRAGGKTAHLMLLMYPTQQLAKKYYDGLEAAAGRDQKFRKRVGPLIAIVRGSDDPDVAQTILAGVNYESQVTWDEPRPDLSLRTVILTIFSFIGIALLFTFVAGVSFGGLRIFVKARYPDRVFDRPEDMEIIQLKLAEGLMQKQLRD